jgi:hypothetical protein
MKIRRSFVKHLKEKHTFHESIAHIILTSSETPVDSLCQVPHMCYIWAGTGEDWRLRSRDRLKLPGSQRAAVRANGERRIAVIERLPTPSTPVITSVGAGLGGSFSFSSA